MYETSLAAQAAMFFLSFCVYSMRQYALTNDHGCQDSLIYYWLNSTALNRQPKRILWLQGWHAPAVNTSKHSSLFCQADLAYKAVVAAKVSEEYAGEEKCPSTAVYLVNCYYSSTLS